MEPDSLLDIAKWGTKDQDGIDVDMRTNALGIMSDYIVPRYDFLIAHPEVPADEVNIAGVTFGQIEHNPASGNQDEEFIEIVNCGSTAVDMSGWRLSDATSVRHVFPDSGFVVSPGEFVTVFGGGTPTGFHGKVMTASSGGLSLANSGDVVSLSEPDASLVDIHSYGSEGGSLL